MSEKAVIEAILHDNKAYDKVRLTEEDFKDPKYRVLYRASGEMLDKGLQVDQFALSEYATSKYGELVKISDVLSLEPYNSANVEYYSGLVRQASKLRKIKKLKMVIEDGNDPDVLAHEIEKTLTGLSDSGREIQLLSTSLTSAIDQLEKVYHAKGALTGIGSGFEELDTYTRGFHAGDLIIIAARPSIGKTALALNMASSIALSSRRVGFFSSEMSIEQITKRLLASVARVDLREIENGKASVADFSKLTDGAQKLFNTYMAIDDTPNIGLMDLRSKARRMKRMGCEILFVDYLTLIRHPDRKMPRYQAVGEISKSMKEMARDLEIPIVALSQINREGEGQKPTLAQLRASGEIEEDSDIIMFLHRESRESQDAELSIAKHRNGPTGEIDLTYKAEYVTFKEKWNEDSNTNYQE